MLPAEQPPPSVGSPDIQSLKTATAPAAQHNVSPKPDSEAPIEAGSGVELGLTKKLKITREKLICEVSPDGSHLTLRSEPLPNYALERIEPQEPIRGDFFVSRTTEQELGFDPASPWLGRNDLDGLIKASSYAVIAIEPLKQRTEQVCKWMQVYKLLEIADPSKYALMLYDMLRGIMQARDGAEGFSRCIRARLEKETGTVETGMADLNEKKEQIASASRELKRTRRSPENTQAEGLAVLLGNPGLSGNEIADQIKVPRSTFHRYLKEGKMPILQKALGVAGGPNPICQPAKRTPMAMLKHGPRRRRPSRSETETETARAISAFFCGIS